MVAIKVQNTAKAHRKGYVKFVADKLQGRPIGKKKIGCFAPIR